MKGIVKCPNNRKGYNHIICQNDEKEIVVHHSYIPIGVYLNEDHPVEIDIVKSGGESLAEKS